MLQGKYAQINAMLAPKSTEEEIQEEVGDLQARSEVLIRKPQDKISSGSNPVTGDA
jgi:hypothetical protein